MNDRIKQLARQCNAYSKDDDGQETKIAILIGKEVEKFAELIVAECVRKIENEAAQYAEPVWAFELVNDINEHFGVENEDLLRRI